jgi:phenylpropionate dioxygenase-like ring-hydroxylating dioxygenase large terminal subunit
MFLHNGWYVVAWSDEVTGDLQNRLVLNKDILIYRGEDGEPVAMDNRCPHRFAPLHFGKRVGNAVQCAYHGLHFDKSGTCVLNPNGGGAIPPAAKVHDYPVKECYGLVWLWMGQPELANTTPIPDVFSFLDGRAGLTPSKGYQFIKANYQLIADNLMDHAHVPTLHANTIGTDTTKDPVHVTRAPRTVEAKQSTVGASPSALIGQLLPGVSAIDRWADMRWDAPSLFSLDSGSTPTGASRDEGARFLTAHLLTPADEKSTHYFWVTCRTFRPDDPDMTEQIRANAEYVFVHEDQWMLEAIQKGLGSADFLESKPALMQSDAAMVATRRALAQLIAQELGE